MKRLVSGIIPLLMTSLIPPGTWSQEVNPLPPPQIAVSPSIIETQIGRHPVGEAIKLFNLGEKPVIIKVSVVNWDLDENNKVRELPPQPHSLDQSIIINPLLFSIPPKQQQTVRLSIRPRHRLPDGEHRAMVYFEEQKTATDSDTTVQVMLRLGIAVYGLAGEIRREGVLHDLILVTGTGKNELVFDIESTGNANVRFEGQYSVWKDKDFPADVPLFDLRDKDAGIPAEIQQIASIPNTPVLAGSRRQLRVSVPALADSGSYILLVQGSLGQEQVRETFPLLVP